MLYCPVCGCEVGENTSFCPKCGASLKQSVQRQSPTLAIDSLKPRTAFSNGIFIGAGAATLIVCLVGVFTLNSSYETISNYLSIIDPPANVVRLPLRTIVSLLSLCVFGAVLGLYTLTMGSLNQFSVKARLAWERKDTASRRASGLMSGGAVLCSLSASNVVRQLYDSSFGWFGLASVLFTFLGGFLIAIGVFTVLKAKVS